MLLKLIHYEIKATYKIILSALITLIPISLIIGKIVSILKDRSFDAVMEYSQDTYGIFMIASFLQSIYSMLVTSVMVLILIVILVRMKTVFFGKDGYIMHTIPIKSGQLIQASVITGAFWLTVAHGVVVYLSSTEGLPPGLYDYTQVFSFEENESLVQHLNPVVWLILNITQPLSILMSMTVGHSFKKNRGFMSVVAFLVYYISFVVLRMMVQGTGDVMFLISFDIAFSILFIIFAYRITQKLLETRLNLD